MKKIYFYLALPLICCLFAACGGDDDEDEKKKETIVELTTENLTDDGYFDGLLYYQILSNAPKQAEVKKALKSCQVVKVPDKIKIGNDVYSIVQIGEKAFKDCKSLVSIELPNSLTSIEHAAFGGCTSLKSITIPNSVTSIGEYAFEGCSGLMSIYCKSTTPPECAYYYDPFDYDLYPNVTLYVPVGSLNNYKSKYPWKKFNNIVEENN